MPKKITCIQLTNGVPIAMPARGEIKEIVILHAKVMALVVHDADQPRTRYRTFHIISEGVEFEETPKHQYLGTVAGWGEGAVTVYEVLPPTKEELHAASEQAFKVDVYAQLRQLQQAVFGPPPIEFGTQAELDESQRRYDARVQAVLRASGGA